MLLLPAKMKSSANWLIDGQVWQDCNKEQYLKDVLAREDSGTTGLGDGIATPHAKSSGVKEAGLAAITVPAGTDFDSMDGLPSVCFS